MVQSRVFVVDDQPNRPRGLTLLLHREPDLTVCSDASDTITALDAIEALKPDILIVGTFSNGNDYSFPRLSWPKAVRKQLPRQ